MNTRRTSPNRDWLAWDLLTLAVAGVVMLALVSGCIRNEDPNTFEYEGMAPSTPPRPVAATYGYPPEPPVVDSLGLRDFADRFRGRVVLLDFWASWCNRCRDEMPRMVELQRQFKNAGVQVISCNLDDSRAWTRQTVPYLQGVFGNFPAVVVPQTAKGPLRDWLGRDWDFGLPARFLIDEKGEVVGRMLEGDSIEQVARAVEVAVQGSGEDRFARRGNTELRARLIDVNSGMSESLDPIFADSADAGHMADELAKAVARQVSTRTRRIALLPIASGGDRLRTGGIGREISERAATSLRRLGYNDLVEVDAASRELNEKRLNVAALEFDPAQVRGRLSADYVVLGFLSGADTQQSAQRE